MFLILLVGFHISFTLTDALFNEEAVDIGNRIDFSPVIFKNLLGVVEVVDLEPTGTPYTAATPS